MNISGQQLSNKQAKGQKMALGKGIASLLQANSSDVLMGGINQGGAQELKTMINEQKNNLNNVAAKSAPVQEVTGTPMLVDVSAIKANLYQPRRIFKDKDLEELTLSIQENGIIQPLVISKLEEGGFELIAGERRLRAAKKAGLEKVPCIVKKTTDRERLVMAIIENVQRSDLNCIEEALAYYRLMEEFKLTQEEVSKRVGKERSTVANFLRVLKLPRKVVEMLQREILSFGHAKVLAAVKEIDQIELFANEVVANNLSVRELEELVKKGIKSGSSSANNKKAGNEFFNEKLDSLKQSLEKKTGFHFDIKSKNGSSGQILIKYTNEAEFNDVFAYLMNR